MHLWISNWGLLHIRSILSSEIDYTYRLCCKAVTRLIYFLVWINILNTSRLQMGSQPLKRTLYSEYHSKWLEDVNNFQVARRHLTQWDHWKPLSASHACRYSYQKHHNMCQKQLTGKCNNSKHAHTKMNTKVVFFPFSHSEESRIHWSVHTILLGCVYSYIGANSNFIRN